MTSSSFQEERTGRLSAALADWITLVLARDLLNSDYAGHRLTFQLHPSAYEAAAERWWDAVGALFMALHSAQGPRLGVPQMIQSRAQFGYFGALLVVLVAVVMYIGFFASNLVLGGQSINQLASGVSVDWGIVICALVSLVITIFGYDLIHAVNRWVIVVFGGVMILSLIFIAGVHGLPANFLSTGHFSGGGFLSAMSLGVLWQIAYAPYVSDYSRYMPPSNEAGSTFWMSYWGTVLGSVLPMLLGAVVGVASTNPNQIAELRILSGGVGWIVMIVFALGIMDTNSINLYGGVLCSITTGPTFARRWIPGARARAILSVAIVAPSLVLAIGLQANFLTNYTNFILLLLYVLIPWTAINLVDFYLIRRGNYDVEAFFDPTGGPCGRIGWIGVIAYLVGILVEVPFMSTTLWTGPAASAMNGTDLSWIVGLVITVPLYYLLATRFITRRPAAAPEPARRGAS
jgi:purine-cytosine permease-like protein